jgi:hypothetical protein
MYAMQQARAHTQTQGRSWLAGLDLKAVQRSNYEVDEYFKPKKKKLRGG